MLIVSPEKTEKLGGGGGGGGGGVEMIAFPQRSCVCEKHSSREQAIIQTQ